MQTISFYWPNLKMINEFSIYCTQWKLNVNVEKAKILIFSKVPITKRHFYYNSSIKEMLKNSNILVLYFPDQGHFVKPRNIYVNKPKKLFWTGVIRKIRLFNSISCQFDLFDKVVLPVLIYGCEIWGYENLQVVECTHLKVL